MNDADYLRVATEMPQEFHWEPNIYRLVYLIPNIVTYSWNADIYCGYLCQNETRKFRYFEANNTHVFFSGTDSLDRTFQLTWKPPDPNQIKVAMDFTLQDALQQRSICIKQALFSFLPASLLELICSLDFIDVLERIRLLYYYCKNDSHSWGTKNLL